MYWNNTTERLSIGSTSTSATLSVIGNGNNGGILVSNSISADEYGILRGPVSGNGTPAQESFRIKYKNNFNGAGQDYLVIDKTDGNSADPDGGIAFTNTGNDNVEETSMIITGNGNIGIGKSTPLVKLHVNGDILANTINGTFIGNGAGLTSIPSSAVTAAGSNTQIQFNSSNSFAASSNLTWDNSTNRLGINTSSPASALQVNGYALIGYPDKDTVAIGDSAAANNTGSHINAIGYYAADSNSGDYVNALGYQAASFDNTGSYVNAIGHRTGFTNAGSYVNAIGYEAGLNNTKDKVNVIGFGTGEQNTGNYLNAIGNGAAQYNSGHQLNAFGLSSAINNTGSNVNAIGYQVAENNTGDALNAIGNSAAASNIGDRVNAIGTLTAANNTGDDINSLGYASAQYNSGNGIIAIGKNTLSINNGDFNIAIGHLTGSALNNGAENILIGYDVEVADNNGSNQLTIGNLIFGTGIDGTGTSYSSGNIGIGDSSPDAKLDVQGTILATTFNGTFIGNGAGLTGLPSGASSLNDLSDATVTSSSVLIGSSSYADDGTNNYNTALGNGALSSTTTGNSNTAIGHNSLNGNISGNNNTAIGLDSLYTNTGSANTAIGRNSLKNNTIGNFNTAIGYQTSMTNKEGDSNIAIGSSSLASNANGSYNVAIGYASLFKNTTDKNVAIGYYSLYNNTTGVQNTATGDSALFTNSTGNYNTATGVKSLYSNTTGTQNTATGVHSLYSNSGGNYNTASGYYAANNNTNGDYNTAIGHGALYAHTTGNNNSALGYRAGFGSSSTASNGSYLGYKAAYSVTTGDNNISIGYQAGDNIKEGSSNIIIGYDVDAPTVNGSEQLVIGNLIYGTGVDGTGTTLSAGNVGIGVNNPSEKLHIEGGVFINGSLSDPAFNGVTLKVGGGGIKTIGQSITADASGFDAIPGSDSYRIRRDNNFFGTGEDAMIIEKTDANTSTPDGGIAFVNTGSDGVVDTAMVIKGDGKVGVGTDSVQSAMFMQIEDNQPRVFLTHNGIPATGGDNEQDELGALYFGGYDGSTYQASAQIIGETPITWSGSEHSADLYFKTASGAGGLTRRMVITNAGNVGIGTGTSSVDYTLEVTGTAGKSDGVSTWANSSDRRLKDIGANYDKGLNEIVKLQPIEYKYKENNARDLPSEGTKIGFIAQEVQKVFPEAVSEAKDGYLDLSLHAVNVAVVNAIKELKSENDMLREALCKKDTSYEFCKDSENK